MVRVQMEDLMKQIGSRYKLVIVAATRTLELSDGKPKLTEVASTTKLATIALKEIAEGKVSYELPAAGKKGAE